jgi:ABC-type spermidine/putrescine transport system permease subunit II
MRNYRTLFLLTLSGFLAITILNYMIVFIGLEGAWYLITGTKVLIDGWTSLSIIVGTVTVAVILAIATATFFDRYAEEMESLDNFAMLPLYDELGKVRENEPE